MDLKQLNYFLTIVEHRSFRKAADALGVSQPALSISIKQLEQTLDCVLLNRAPGRVVPTSFGLSLCESARRIQQEVTLAQARLHKRLHNFYRQQEPLPWIPELSMSDKSSPQAVALGAISIGATPA